MKTFSSKLLHDLESELLLIHQSTNNPIQYAEKGIHSAIKAIEKLKSFFLQYEFENKNAEIDFFKNTKPLFASKLIYYNEIYNIEVAKPVAGDKLIRSYYKNQLIKLKEFYCENTDFYKYYNTNNTVLDAKYFMRRKYDIRLTIDSSYFQSDFNFTTSHDYKMAKVIANVKIQEFLSTKLNKQDCTQPAVQSQSNLKWTGTRVALVELMYALNTEGVFNNGNISMNDLAKNLETLFNIELGQFRRSFMEIKTRKTIEKTSFLNTLKQKLVLKMELADEK